MTKARAATTNDMGEKAQQDLLQDWDRMAPVGGEFGSPDYERLEELDHLAVLERQLDRRPSRRGVSVLLDSDLMPLALHLHVEAPFA